MVTTLSEGEGYARVTAASVRTLSACTVSRHHYGVSEDEAGMATEAGVAGGRLASDLASARDTTVDADDEAPWLLRDPLRTVAIVLTVIALGVRLSVVKDSFFITDDFMLSARAVENSFGWDYLTPGAHRPLRADRLRHDVAARPPRPAQLDRGRHRAHRRAGGARRARVVALVELFGRRWLVLLPYGIFCLTPLTLPAFTWLSAAIIWLPLMIAIAGALRSHTRYVGTVAAATRRSPWCGSSSGWPASRRSSSSCPISSSSPWRSRPVRGAGSGRSGRSSGAPLRCGSATSPPSPSTSCSTSPGCAAPATTPP